MGIHWKNWCWSWNFKTLATWCEELTHLKRPWCWERLRAGGEQEDRWWEGWMASPTQCTWVWVGSGSWCWTGRPGMLQLMGLQRVGHKWANELNWTELLLGRKTVKNLNSILKSRDITANKGSYSQSYGFSSSPVWMWQLDHKEGWVLKNRCFPIVVLEKTLESPLNCKEIKPVNPKGNQSWIFTGRTGAEAEAPILWPPDVKSQLIRKDPYAGKDWGQEEKGATEDEMVGWHHWLNGHEFEQDSEDSEGQEAWRAARPWGHKEPDTDEWTNNNKWLINTHILWRSQISQI